MSFNEETPWNSFVLISFSKSWSEMWVQARFLRWFHQKQAEQKRVNSFIYRVMWCIPTQATVSLQTWLISSVVTNCCHPNSSWQPFNFPFHLVSLTLVTYGSFPAPAPWLPGKPMAWALQTSKSMINFQHLAGVRKNCLQIWILNAWKLLVFSGHNLGQQYKGTILHL